jgi:hypothetical protein
LGISFGSNATRARFVEIADAHEIADAFRRERGVQPRVLRAEMADSNDCGS